MTPDAFRRLALSMQGAVEASHMNHPDFRVNGRIFATLHSNDRFGMVALTPEVQQEFLRASPAAFEPSSGAWGRQGCTNVRLEAGRRHGATRDDPRVGSEKRDAATPEAAAEGDPAGGQSSSRRETPRPLIDDSVPEATEIDGGNGPTTEKRSNGGRTENGPRPRARIG